MSDLAESKELPRAIAALLDRAIPVEIKRHSEDTLRRARLFVVLVVALSAAVGGFGLAVLGGEELNRVTVITLFGALMTWSAIPLMRRTGSLAVGGNFLVAVVFMVLVSSGLRNGGMGLPATFACGLVPLVAGLIAGRRSATVWIVLSVAFLVSLEMLHRSGFAFSSEFNPAAAHRRQFLGALTLTALLGSIAVIYEWLKGTALRTLEERNRELEARSRELREATRRMRASELQHRAVVEYAGEGILGIDAHGVVLSFNRAASAMFGYAASEVVGFYLSRLLPGAYVTDEEPVSGSDADAGFLLGSREVDGIRKDGRKFPLSVTFAELPIGDTCQYTAVVRDLSERRAMETRLLQAQKLESIGKLAAGVAYEINTPAQDVGNNLQFLGEAFEELGTLLKSYRSLADAARSGAVPAELLVRTTELESEVDLGFLEGEILRAVSESRNGIGRVTKIVRAMNDFSAPRSEDKVPVDINRAIESTLIVASSEWKCVADVETNFQPDLPAVPCFAGEINQVLLNIIVNAAHALAGAGRGDGQAKGRIEISTSRVDDQALIVIADNGPGMSEEIRSRVFGPSLTTKALASGTGQGLSVVHAVIVEQHGGSIEVASETGRGTEFRIRLPLGAEAAQVPAAAIEASGTLQH